MFWGFLPQVRVSETSFAPVAVLTTELERGNVFSMENFTSKRRALFQQKQNMTANVFQRVEKETPRDNFRNASRQEQALQNCH